MTCTGCNKGSCLHHIRTKSSYRRAQSLTMIYFICDFALCELHSSNCHHPRSRFMNIATSRAIASYFRQAILNIMQQFDRETEIFPPDLRTGHCFRTMSVVCKRAKYTSLLRKFEHNKQNFCLLTDHFF